MPKTKLLARLERCGFPRFVVAGNAGIHPTTLGEYANDKRLIPPRHLQALAELLDCEPRDLRGYEDALPVE